MKQALKINSFVLKGEAAKNPEKGKPRFLLTTRVLEGKELVCNTV